MSITSTGASDNEKLTVSSIAILRRSQVCEALGVSTWTLDRWIRNHQFPRPIFLTPDSNVGVWPLRVVEAFLEQRRRARRVKPKARGMFLRTRKRARSRTSS
jgi:predicted DNA-binding transcriptional regulator AlpA